MATKEIQQESIAKEDLTPYRGSWVALRNGRVIASALDPIELRDRDDVREDDNFVLVPSELGGTFVL